MPYKRARSRKALFGNAVVPKRIEATSVPFAVWGMALLALAMLLQQTTFCRTVCGERVLCVGEHVI